MMMDVTCAQYSAEPINLSPRLNSPMSAKKLAFFFLIVVDVKKEKCAPDQ